jgi:hypothetical protein
VELQIKTKESTSVLTKHQVVNLILQEREYQDRKFRADEVLQSGISRLQRDQDVTPHLVLLDSYIRKAKDTWTNGGGSIESLKEIAKIAAIAFRALERVGGGTVLLQGLRDDGLKSGCGQAELKSAQVLGFDRDAFVGR